VLKQLPLRHLEAAEQQTCGENPSPPINTCHTSNKWNKHRVVHSQYGIWTQATLVCRNRCKAVVTLRRRFFYAVSLPLLLGGIVYMLWYMPAPDTPTSVKVNVGLAW
jgi:hypothetical protein